MRVPCPFSHLVLVADVPSCCLHCRPSPFGGTGFVWFLSLGHWSPPPFAAPRPVSRSSCLIYVAQAVWECVSLRGSIVESLPNHESPVFPNYCITRTGNSYSPRPSLWPRCCVSGGDGDSPSGVGVLGIFTTEGASKDGNLLAKARTPALSDNGASVGWPPSSFRGC